MAAGRRRHGRLTVLPGLPPGVSRRGRLVDRRGDAGPIRVGMRSRWFDDLYHRTLTLRWPAFLGAGAALYLLLNVIFALLYFAVPGSIEHAAPGSFADAFFFSVQTMATIGYGVLVPANTWANCVVTAQTLVSLLFTTFAAGITFARFARPTARILFSSVVPVSRYNGVPTLFVRLANGRRNQIIEADVTVALLRNETTAEGLTMRRFYDLRLARSHTPIFSLSFTVMHEITPDSPLHGMDAARLAEEDVELLVAVTGLDETMSQTIHARTSYVADEFRFGRRFQDMFGYTPEGRLVIDHSLMDAVEAAAL